MAIVNIPQDDIVNFQELMDFSDNDFSELIALLENLPIELRVSNLHNALRDSNINNGEKFTAFIANLVLTPIKHDVELKDFIDQLYISFIEKNGKSEKDFFYNRIFQLTTSAESLITAYEITKSKTELGHYVNGHTLSISINPLFDKNDDLFGNLMMYTLKIQYEDGDTTILSLDRENLLKLKQSIENIELKSENLIDIFDNSNIRVID